MIRTSGEGPGYAALRQAVAGIDRNQLGLTGLIEARLFGVAATDPFTFAANKTTRENEPITRFLQRTIA